MAIDLNMCEPTGSDLKGHGSHRIVLKLNAPINSQTVGNKELVETFFDLNGPLTCTLVVMMIAELKSVWSLSQSILCDID